MYRASLALAQGLAEGVPRSLRAIADHGDVRLSTVRLHARARGRGSIEAEVRSQQYLTPLEGKAVMEFILEMSDLQFVQTVVRDAGYRGRRASFRIV